MKIKLLFALLIVQLGFAQQRTCGMQGYLDQIMADPILKQEYLERQAKFEIELEKLEAQQARNQSENVVNSPNVVIKIPVAVHFPSVSNSSSASVKNCLRALAQSQIDVINADYNATNADISNWTADSAFYPGVNIGNMGVQFEIATQNHPSGTGIANGVAAVTFGTDFLDAAYGCSNGCNSDATWAGYMNFVVKNIGGSLLGYSPLGGSPVAGNTVVMNTICFGAGSGCTGYVPSYPYDLGRTVTHELGHFFNLNHTFNGCDSSGCSTSGDRVCDTPPCNAPQYNCLAAGSDPSGCGATPQLTMNYMDYVEDGCMYMFTEGQKNRMIAYYNAISSQYLTNVLGNTDFIASNFSIAPNPNNGIFSIRLKEATTDYSVVINDALGREIYNKDFNNSNSLVQDIQLNTTLNGLYFVSIKSNGATLTKKILVE